jgi:hypothetical protein
MHGPLRGFADDPPEEAARKMSARAVYSTKESVVTGISSMECSNNVAALFETANLLANKSFHPPESVRWFRGQDEHFCFQLLPSASFEQFVLWPDASWRRLFGVFSIQFGAASKCRKKTIVSVQIAKSSLEF